MTLNQLAEHVAALQAKDLGDGDVLLLNVPENAKSVYLVVRKSPDGAALSGTYELHQFNEPY